MTTRSLRIYKVSVAPVASEDEAVPLAYPNSLGTQTKLGGVPYWIQSDETPACPHCREPMAFLAQLDSIEHQSKHNPHARDAITGGQHYMFGDVGMIYVFFCYECCEPASIFQCY